MIRKAIPKTAGRGELRFSGHRGPADYVIDGDPNKLRLGGQRLRAALKSTPDVALAAFRAGDGYLVLEDGVALRLVTLGHAAGSNEVFVELRV